MRARSAQDQTAHNQTFSSPSPGEILRRNRRSRPSPIRPNSDGPSHSDTEFECSPFEQDFYLDAQRERGILLAPLVVVWRYRVGEARRFAKWLRTKEVLLSDARLSIQEATRGIHYFGTYILAPSAAAEQPASSDSGVASSISCQTLWGFSDQGSLDHMFDLCRGGVDRLTIVETDLRDFVTGLKGHIGEVGSEHFSQQVMVVPSAL